MIITVAEAPITEPAFLQLTFTAEFPHYVLRFVANREEDVTGRMQYGLVNIHSVPDKGILSWIGSIPIAHLDKPHVWAPALVADVHSFLELIPATYDAWKASR